MKKPVQKPARLFHDEKKEHKQFINDARSYSGIETFTDHPLVKAKLNISWYKLNPSKIKARLCVESLNNDGYKKEISGESN